MAMPRERKPITVCRRCGGRPPRPGSSHNQVCEECYGKCRECGGATKKDSEGYPKALCNACLAKQTTTCTKCGGPANVRSPYRCDDCIRTEQREYKRRDLAKERDKQRRYRTENPTKMRTKHTRKQLARYGLSVGAYEAMVTAQDGRCAI